MCLYISKALHGNLSTVDLENCLQVQGRLKVCSRSLIFEPNDVKRPVLKYPFKGMLSSVHEVLEISSSSGFLSFRAGSFLEMKANNKVTPYKLVEVGAGAERGSNSGIISETVMNQTPSSDGHVQVVFALLHSDIKSTVRKIEQLRLIFVESESTGTAEQMLQPFIQSASSTTFDSSQLVDFHEKLLLDEAVFVKRIKPLMQNPGLFMVTEARVYFQPAQLNNIGDKMQCIPLSKVSKVYCRRYLLRQTGLEFLMFDGSSTLFVFTTRLLRDKIYKLLISANITIAQETGGVTYRSGQSLDTITRKWQNRDMSNFEYLLYLNNEADRSVNDLTQYPVFPHIVADFESEKLDLEDPETFRDLSKPIGALNPKRLEHFINRFESMPDEDEDYGIPPPFIYGTHYSTPGYVLHYLVRVAPEFMFCLQNGKFDAPDRMFYSMKDTWDSCLQNPTDLKELIPEFFCGAGDFLKNSEDLDLGRRQTGDRVDNVELPAWAKSPQDFIRKNRKALECDYVSEHIHEWIDLIFGYKQKGAEAIDANNLYYYLTYEGSVDLEQEKDARRRAALEIQIQEFGQTPKQLFAVPHPARNAIHAPVVLCQDINVNTIIEKQAQKEDDMRLESDFKLTSDGTHDKDLITNVITLGDDFRAEVVKLEESLSGKSISTSPGTNMRGNVSPNVAAKISADDQNNPNTFVSPQSRTSKVGSIFNSWTGKTARFLDRTLGSSLSESFNITSKTDHDDMRGLTAEEAVLIDSFRSSPASPVVSSVTKISSTGPVSLSSAVNSPAVKVVSNESGILATTKAAVARREKKSLEAFGSFTAHADAINDISAVYVRQNLGESDNNNAGYVVVCTCSKDSTMKIYHVNYIDCIFSTQREFKSGSDHDFSSCCLTNDGKHALLGGWDRRVYSYSVSNACATGKHFVHDDVVSSIAFVNEASNLTSLYGTNMLLTGALDGSVKLWRVLHNNLLSGQPAAEFQDHENAIQVVALKDDVKMAAAGADDGKVIVWNIQTQLTVLTCKISSRSPVTGIAWMFDDKLVSSTKIGCLTFIDVSPAAVSSAALGFSTILATTQLDSEIISLVPLENALDRVGNPSVRPIVACGCGDGSIRIHALTKLVEEIYRFPRAHEAPVTALSFLPLAQDNQENLDQKMMLLSGAANGTMRAWHVVCDE